MADVLRTPDERFQGLPGYDFAPAWLDAGGLRIHYVDDGPRDAAPVLLLHGEPSWSYLYRTMIPVLRGAGLRCVAPDLIGFGRSDKPVAREDYTYQRHVDWMRAVLVGLDLRDVTLVCQDWGGLIGLRLVAEHPERFARVVVANTFLPTGDVAPGPAFLAWRKFSQEVPELPIGRILQGGRPRSCRPRSSRPTRRRFRTSATRRARGSSPPWCRRPPTIPPRTANRAAWTVLERWTKPFLTAFSDSDPITAGADRVFQRRIPGAQGQPHTTIVGGGHFLQEDRGPELARVVADFVARP